MVAKRLRFSRGPVQLLFRATVIGVLGLSVLGGCGRSKESGSGEATEARDATHPAQVSVVPASATRELSANSHFDEEAFDVQLRPVGASHAGKASLAEVVLTAKAPYHVNQEYPLKFKLEPTDGLKLAAAVVGKDAAKVETMKATVPVEFTPEGPGSKRLAGTLAFSLCTAERCLMEKRSLAVDISVQ